MIALTFLQPWLLWALPLAVVPIVIHLLNRRRFQTRRWAAMEFLLRAMERNRRRMRMEHWLVLLLRVLAVLFLVFLVARPRFDGSAFGADVIHHIVCVDDSPSMATRGNSGDAMDGARRAVRTLAESFTRLRPGDVFSLVSASSPDRPLIAGVPTDASLLERLRPGLDRLHVGDLPIDLRSIGNALEGLASRTETATKAHFVLVSDLRRIDWVGRDGQLSTALVEWLTRLDPARGQVEILDVGHRDAENLSVADLRCAERVATVGVPLEFEVEVRNHGAAPSAPAELNLTVDGRTRGILPVASILPGESTVLKVRETFHAVGAHALRAELPADRFAIDDARAFALDVRASSRVFLVDGAPGDEPQTSESWFLAAALDPSGEGNGGIEVLLRSERELADVTAEELVGVDWIAMTNVARVTPAVAAKLAGFVRSGGGLAIWLGDQVDVANYNTTLWDQGRGLLPLSIVGTAGDLDRPIGIHLSDESADLFPDSRSELRDWFGKLVLVGRWFELREDATTPVEVSLRAGDRDGAPLLVSRGFPEGGRVHLLTTSADAQWTDWPRWPPFIMTVRRLHATGARAQPYGLTNLTPRDVLRVEVDPTRHRPDVEVRQEFGSAESVTMAAPPSGSEVATVDVAMRDLSGYGVFVAARRLHAGGEEPTRFARNPVREESALAAVTATALEALIPEPLRDRCSIHSADVSEDGSAEQGGAAWRMLAWAMLLALLVESLLAWRFGRR
ncbi:MAG: BatA domain-containing protein [Planctomycetota bacterium]